MRVSDVCKLMYLWGFYMSVVILVDGDLNEILWLCRLAIDFEEMDGILRF